MFVIEYDAGYCFMGHLEGTVYELEAELWILEHKEIVAEWREYKIVEI